MIRVAIILELENSGKTAVSNPTAKQQKFEMRLLQSLLSRQRLLSGRIPHLLPSLYHHHHNHHHVIRYSYSSSSSNHVRYSGSPAKHSLKLTEAARNQLLEIRKRDGKPYSLRVTVVPGGCHGFQINLNLEEENNSVKDMSAEDDVYLNVENDSPPLLIVDKTSLELINGAEVDFVSELIGSTFQVLKIPNAQSGCGCGVSFDLKQQ